MWTLSWEADSLSLSRVRKKDLLNRHFRKSSHINTTATLEACKKLCKMATRRKSKRSLSLRTASFIRLLTPFGGGNGEKLAGGKLSGSAQLAATSAVREESGGRLYPAVSDSTLHVAASNSVESHRRRQQIVDSSGRIITQVGNILLKKML